MVRAGQLPISAALETRAQPPQREPNHTDTVNCDTRNRAVAQHPPSISGRRVRTSPSVKPPRTSQPGQVDFGQIVLQRRAFRKFEEEPGTGISALAAVGRCAAGRDGALTLGHEREGTFTLGRPGRAPTIERCQLATPTCGIAGSCRDSQPRPPVAPPASKAITSAPLGASYRLMPLHHNVFDTLDRFGHEESGLFATAYHD